MDLQGLEIVTLYLVLSCRQIIYLTGLTLPWVARSEIEILGDSKELENILTLGWPFVLNWKPQYVHIYHKTLNWLSNESSFLKLASFQWKIFTKAIIKSLSIPQYTYCSIHNELKSFLKRKYSFFMHLH